MPVPVPHPDGVAVAFDAAGERAMTPPMEAVALLEAHRCRVEPLLWVARFAAEPLVLRLDGRAPVASVRLVTLRNFEGDLGLPDGDLPPPPPGGIYFAVQWPGGCHFASLRVVAGRC